MRVPAGSARGPAMLGRRQRVPPVDMDAEDEVQAVRLVRESARAYSYYSSQQVHKERSDHRRSSAVHIWLWNFGHTSYPPSRDTQYLVVKAWPARASSLSMLSQVLRSRDMLEPFASLPLDAPIQELEKMGP